MKMLPVFIGLALALFIATYARLCRFDQDRSFFAVTLVVISAYYVLFACIAQQAIVSEIAVAGIFILLATAGAQRWPVLLGIGIAGHGIFDFVHHLVIQNAGVPHWWPLFCGSIDIALGLWVMYLLNTKRIKYNGRAF